MLSVGFGKILGRPSHHPAHAAPSSPAPGPSGSIATPSDVNQLMTRPVRTEPANLVTAPD